MIALVSILSSADSKRIFRWLVPLAAVLLTLLVSELAFRQWGPVLPPPTYEGDSMTPVPKGRRHCFSAAVRRAYFEKDQGCVTYDLNEAGFRRSEPTALNRPSSVYRVLALGDSFTYGYGVYAEDTFTARMENALNVRAPQTRTVEILNAGQPGLATKGEIDLYRKKFARFRPNLVILGLHLNDFLSFPTSYFTDTRSSWTRRLRPYFQLFDFLWVKANQLAESRKRIERVRAEATDVRIAEVIKGLVEFQNELALQGSRFHVALFPVLIHLEDYPFLDVHRRLVQGFKAQGIAHTDLYPSVKGRSDRSLWITANDQHPNEDANRLFAEALLSSLTPLP